MIDVIDDGSLVECVLSLISLAIIYMRACGMQLSSSTEQQALGGLRLLVNKCAAVHSNMRKRSSQAAVQHTL